MQHYSEVLYGGTRKATLRYQNQGGNRTLPGATNPTTESATVRLPNWDMLININYVLWM